MVVHTPRARPSGVKTPRSARVTLPAASAAGLAKSGARAVARQPARANSSSVESSHPKELITRHPASSPFLKQDVETELLPYTRAAAIAVANADFMSLWFSQKKSVPATAHARPRPSGRVAATAKNTAATIATAQGATATDGSALDAKPPTGSTPQIVKRACQGNKAQRSRYFDEVFVLRCQRKIRESKELNSSDLGVLPAGTVVRILERAALPDGTQRARVGKLDDSVPIG